MKTLRLLPFAFLLLAGLAVTQTAPAQGGRLRAVVVCTSEPNVAAEGVPLRNATDVDAFARKHKSIVLSDGEIAVVVFADAIAFDTLQIRLQTIEALNNLASSSFTLQELGECGVNPALLDYLRLSLPDTHGQEGNPDFRLALTAIPRLTLSDGVRTEETILDIPVRPDDQKSKRTPSSAPPKQTIAQLRQAMERNPFGPPSAPKPFSFTLDNYEPGPKSQFLAQAAQLIDRTMQQWVAALETKSQALAEVLLKDSAPNLQALVGKKTSALSQPQMASLAKRLKPDFLAKAQIVKARWAFKVGYQLVEPGPSGKTSDEVEITLDTRL